ncbi:MAG: DUF3570 domain-containing protein [Chlorobiaceae bacterium]|nr:DUF3570 domain-containing protein [Chlorobiaceae bacterium]
MKSTPYIKSTRVLGAALTAAAMLLPSGKSALADAAPEKGIVAYKFLNYRDSQPGQERMNINVSTIRVMTPIAGKWAIDVVGANDFITGASPHFHNYIPTDSVTGASKLRHDTRRSIDLNVTRYFSSGSVTAGTSYSQESDYISRSYSLQSSISTPNKNTTVTFGGSITKDSINPNNLRTYSDQKKIYSALVGLTQVMSKNDIVQVNLSRSIGSGYYTDSYRVFDERPRHRNYTTVLSRWNHYFDSTEGASRLSYRYYTDTFGIKAHTFSAEYVQPLPQGFTITPSVRLYSQTAASFYVPIGPDEIEYPDSPSDYGSATFYSEDQRLSAYGAVTLAFKVSKRFADSWLVDVRYDHYMQRGHWAISGTPDSNLLAFNADFIQLGLSKEF